MSEKISIIVPVYNTEKYLHCFFSKLEKQTYQDFRAYIVYDQSTDSSLEIIKEYEKKNPSHFEIIYSPRKDGLGAARDCALDSGKIVGEYVLFLDPDDYPELNFLEKLVNKADKTHSDITICGFDRFEDETNHVLTVEMIHNPNHVVHDISKFDLMAYMNPVVWDKLYRRELINGLRFSNIKRTEDVFWLMRMIPRIKSISFVNEVLYHYRVRKDSLLNSISRTAYDDVINNFISVRKELDDYYGEDSIYKNILDLIGFFRCGIGITYRAAINDKNNISYYTKKSKKVLNEYYSGWNDNPYLTFRSCKNRGLKGLAIYCCKILYKMNLFSIYVYIFSLITSKLKKDIKW